MAASEDEDASSTDDDDIYSTIQPSLLRTRTSRRVSTRRKKKLQKKLEQESINLVNSAHNKSDNMIATYAKQANDYCKLSYNFTASPSKPIWANKQDAFKTMTLSTYHQNSKSKSYHDLTTSTKPLANLERLLSKGKKHIPQRPKVDIKQHVTYLDRFKKDMRAKYLMRDCSSEAPKLCCRSPDWAPPPAHPDIEDAIANFESALLSSVVSKHLH